MQAEEDYINLNRQLWNARVESHLNSAFYDIEGFKKGRNSLTVPELELIGDVRGKKILHLQCHFGQETISLARLGASAVGVDLSDKAVDAAKSLAKELNVDAEFACCNIYDLPKYLNTKFDMVFTSFGTIGWLPDLEKWAQVVSHFLKPGGEFVFVEFHPVIWMFDELFDKIQYSYFKDEAIVEVETGSYADRNSGIQLQSVSWNHSMSEVVNNLIKQGLQIECMNEFPYSPYDCFRKTIETKPHQFQIAHIKDKLPLVYAIKASKKK